MLRIKDILKEKNVTVNGLAERLGVTRQTLHRQMQGKLLVETAQRIADALDVPLWKLFAAPEDVTTHGLVAFLHYGGKSHLPTTIDEVMAVLEEYDYELFHKICHDRNFQYIRDRFVENASIQKLVDDLCALMEAESVCEVPQDDTTNNII